MKINKVLIIAAHPDDDILGCGGFIAKHSRNKEIKVVFIAEGTTCRYIENEITGDDAKLALQFRTESSLQSLKILGVSDVKFHDLPCGRLDQFPIIEINKIIEKEIEEFKPDLIMTHSEHDVNNDHRLIYRSVQMATRPVSYNNVCSIMSYEVQSSTEWNYNTVFAPNYFEILNEKEVNMKWESLKCYGSEIREYPHPRSKLGVETLARYRGMQSGVKYAEAYKIIRNIGK